MNHRWAQDALKHVAHGEPQIFKCRECSREVTIIGRWSRGDDGNLVITYPLPDDNCGEAKGNTNAR